MVGRNPPIHQSASARISAIHRKITRNRPALSCTECIRRKIRCDRKRPCAPCVTRGKVSGCIFGGATAPRRRRSDSNGSPSRSITVEATVETSGDNDEVEPPPAMLLASLPTSSRSPLQLSGRNPHLPTWITRQIDVQTEPAVWDVEDYLTAGSMSAKRDFAAPGQRVHREGSSIEPTLDVGNVSMTPAMRRLVSTGVNPLYETLYELVYAALPRTREVMDLLVARYFSHVSWHWHILHKASFLEEYQAFGNLLDVNRHKSVDPLWISILLMVLCAAANSFDDPGDPTVIMLDSEELSKMPPMMLKAAHAALECGDWMGEARLRTLQALSLINAHLMWEAAPHSTGRLERYNVVAVRICQALQLDSIPDDPKQLPDGDPAMRMVSAALQRQMALRLAYITATMDQMNHRHRPALPLEDILSPLPGNYDDDQLPIYGDVDPVPKAHLTESSLIIIHFETARIQRLYQESIRAAPKPPYELLNGIDTRLSNLYGQYQLGHESPNESPQRSWARKMAALNIWTRRVRMVRPWIQFYPSRPEEDTLRKNMIDGARALLRCALELEHESAPLVRGSFYLMHVQSSFLVLIQRVWHLNGPEGLEDDPLLSSALSIFDGASHSIRPSIKRSALIGASTCRLLLECIRDRRKFLGMNESFVHALKRISHTVRRQQEQPAMPELAEFFSQLVPDWQAEAFDPWAMAFSQISGWGPSAQQRDVLN
ncbi:hypothetical protein BCR39DRAFT_545139 [Naematelia encephala]|uniref:Zn(2)-C6 fungal-type domain-containing protein n=1 Tax=Naematelia encephala TaxID=71784 RepID=A0A1Y2AR44_9TREE|nr:hypothetical protein BCR39DRAFT_545139 [Naematelia encephala]